MIRWLVVILSLSACVSTPASQRQNGTPADTRALLVESDPASGAVLAQPPQAVMLLFSQPVRLVEVLVTGPDGLGSPIMITSAGLQTRYVIPVSDIETGTYRVSWRSIDVTRQARQGALSFMVR